MRKFIFFITTLITSFYITGCGIYFYTSSLTLSGEGSISKMPTLDINFESQTMPPLVKFSRGSSATMINSNGFIENVGNNVPRFEYDPVTGEPLGLLIERTRTNLFKKSEKIDDIFWSKLESTIVADFSSAPNNQKTADKINETVNNARHAVFRTLTSLDDDSVYTVSIFGKASEREWIYISTLDKDNDYNISFFNISFGEIGTASPKHVSQIMPMGDGWYRCIVAFNVNSGSTIPTIAIGVTTGDGVESYAGNIASGVFLWGAQLEKFATPTSYIPTNVTTATRWADLLEIKIDSWYSLYAGTFIVNSAPSFVGFQTDFAVLGLSDGTNANGFALFMALSKQMSLVKRLSSATVANFTSTKILTAQNFTISGFYYDNKKIGLYQDGSKIGEEDNLNLTYDFNLLTLGAMSGDSPSMVGHIRRVTYWPRSLSAEEMETSTGIIGQEH